MIAIPNIHCVYKIYTVDKCEFGVSLIVCIYLVKVVYTYIISIRDRNDFCRYHQLLCVYQTVAIVLHVSSKETYRP